MTNEERICMLVKENGVISLEQLALQMGKAEITVKVNHGFKLKVWELIDRKKN